ncbi:hypothetical protein CKA32_004787 [Geitlerinema sp. FC II]|nr:hypothetical protein CKA32_004787 [Geitlerinema sp. FC II]
MRRSGCRYRCCLSQLAFEWVLFVFGVGLQCCDRAVASLSLIWQ